MSESSPTYVTLSAKTSLMLQVHKSGFRSEGHNYVNLKKPPFRVEICGLKQTTAYSWPVKDVIRQQQYSKVYNLLNPLNEHFILSKMLNLYDEISFQRAMSHYYNYEYVGLRPTGRILYLLAVPTKNQHEILIILHSL